MDMQKPFSLEAGKAYVVIKEGSRLVTPISTGYLSWRFEQTSLPVGSIIVYEGSKQGIGSDSISEDIFIYDDTKGSFFPSSWGSADRSYFMPEE